MGCCYDVDVFVVGCGVGFVEVIGDGCGDVVGD